MRDHTHTKSSASTAKPGCILSAWLFAFWLLCAINLPQAQAKPPAQNSIKQQAFQRLQLVGQAMVKADEKMLLQLDKTKDKMQKILVDVNLPTTQDEITKLQYELNVDLETNPYISKEFETEAGVSSNDLPANRNKDRVELVLDPSISQARASDWLENPPTTLNRPAGTIRVLQNGFDLALLYTTSLEGGPVKDPKTGKPRVLILRSDYLGRSPKN